MKCTRCEREFQTGNRPDGFPNCMDFVLRDGSKLTLCAECLMDVWRAGREERKRIFRRITGS